MFFYLSYAAMRSCSDPGYPTNGHRLGEKFWAGETVNYVCNRGYTLVGSDTILCQLDGQWTQDRPLCKNLSIQSRSQGYSLQLRGGPTPPATYRKAWERGCLFFLVQYLDKQFNDKHSISDNAIDMQDMHVTVVVQLFFRLRSQDFKSLCTGFEQKNKKTKQQQLRTKSLEEGCDR